MRRIPHGWTKKSMDRCARTFMDQISWHYLCLADKKDRVEKVFALVEQYMSIEDSVARGLG
jgi:hypothetical protein